MPTGKGKTGFATIDDVAKLANVSRITVSRVYSSKWAGKIRPETVERVLAAARELQYTSNNLARSLSSNRSNIIAVVVNAHPGFFYTRVLTELVETIQAAGWQALVFAVAMTDDLDLIVSQVLQHRVDAIVVTSGALSKSISKYFGARPPIPIVLFKRVPGNPAFNGIWCNEAEGACQAARHLYETGHRNIAIINHPYGETGRSEAFIAQLRELGIEPVAVLSGDYSHASGFEAANQMLQMGASVDAVFCDEDTMAMGAIDALRGAHGLRIPADISVIGFDDNPVSCMPAYDLTTIGHPLEQMLAAIVEAIRVNSEDRGAVIRREFPMQLVRRSSVGNRDAKTK